MVLATEKAPFVEYEIEISTPKGLVVCWKRFREFRILRHGLKRTSNARLPSLPKRRWLCNLSTDTISERKVMLNQFLSQLVANEALQWGIQIDATLAVLKRRRLSVDRKLLDSFTSTTLASPHWEVA
ncbi:hypothetical protein SPRG_07508 [Saprolegnia parasitica CBS 223.65]|uniref:PX domain-containing protein n=1 Tax=Saprolegnia parasitica (strain CBS 223.65) TaxID=695850 RepID=A0A067C933_SAPPC|nr:hypothetical protein SPRG_07508 [Saprolegnia parasitica CBS 223.65]KDO27259.1 hypothetical protein SPRG_07508 [Saprolegnia parasitica CBS 223.65]|eukprot:XP_012202036.1 hypothetical protein SPRG_07508 [Saprolegnia parasitica CBS 223.65]